MLPIGRLITDPAAHGGHFAAWEEPELFATEIRAAFSPPLTTARTWV